MIFIFSVTLYLKPPLKDQRKEGRKNDNKNWFSINFWWHWSYYHHTSNKISLITNLIFNIYPQARRHHDLHYIERYMQWILLCIILYKPHIFKQKFTKEYIFSNIEVTRSTKYMLNEDIEVEALTTTVVNFVYEKSMFNVEV